MSPMVIFYRFIVPVFKSSYNLRDLKINLFAQKECCKNTKQGQNKPNKIFKIHGHSLKNNTDTFRTYRHDETFLYNFDLKYIIKKTAAFARSFCFKHAPLYNLTVKEKK